MKDAAGTHEIVELLTNGHMYREFSHVAGGTPDATKLTHYQAWKDPVGADRLGRIVASRIEGHDIGAVLIWESDEDVLAHVVARELRATVVFGFDEGGLAYLSEPIWPGTGVLILADAFRDAGAPTALCGLVRSSGGHVVCFASLVATSHLDTLDPQIQRVALASEEQIPVTAPGS